MKKILITAVLIIAAGSAFGSAGVHTVDFGAYTYSRTINDIFVIESMQGATYRYTYYPGVTGFYIGGDYTMAYPTYRFSLDSSTYSVDSTPYSSFIQLNVPLGYRWQGTEKKFGFYIGGGPSGSILYGIGADTTAAVGIVLDLGIETNSTEGSAFHFGWQSGWNPLVFEEGSGMVNGSAWTSSLRFGISWRRIKE